MALSVEEKTILVVGLISAGSMIILFIYSFFIYRKGRKLIKKAIGSSIHMTKEEVDEGNMETRGEGDTNNNNNSSTTDINIPNDQIRFIEFGSNRLKIGFIVGSMFVFVFFELLILTLVIFDHLNVAPGCVIMIGCAFFYYGVVIIPPKKKWIKRTINQPLTYKWGRRLGWKITNAKERKGYWVVFAILVLIIIALNVVLEGTCEENLAIVNTRITRRYMKPTCPTGAPCLLYLTLTETPETSVMVNYHTSNNDRVQGQCFYSTSPNIQPKLTNTTLFASGGVFEMNIEVTRYIHYVLLDGLNPNTIYYFICGSSSDGFTKERKFRTASNLSTSTYTFVVGGDVDTTDISMTMNSIASQQDPSFIMMGGDLAYDRAQLTCYRTLDRFLLNYMNSMITSTGLTIPMIATIGNHEVIGDFGAKPSRIPFFTKYFPQRNSYGSESVAVGKFPEDRVTYGHVRLGGPNGTVIFNLDSGHSNAGMNVQVDYMKEILANKSIVQSPQVRMTIYHVPMYPTIRLYENSRSTAVRDNWLSFFDDELNPQVSWENHDHAYKRTIQMMNGQLNSNGTVYIGDGSWGVSKRPPGDKRFYQSITKDVNYVTSVTVNPLLSTLSFKSIDNNNQIFDQGIVLLRNH